MTRIEKQVVIDRPVDEVLKVAKEWGNMPRYLDYIKAVRPLSENHEAKGARLHVDLTFLGRHMTSDWEIVDYQPGEGWTFKKPLMGVEALKHWRFEPVGSATQVSFTLEYEPGPAVIGPLVDALLLCRKWDRTYERGMRELKRLVESP